MKYDSLLQKSTQEKEAIKKEFKRLKKANAKQVDTTFHTLHEKVFKQIDCLSCANCCKTTSPLFRPVDIKRLATHLRVSEQQFISTYLRIDEDNDYVLRTAPCPFLGAENYCSVYESRPLACREYPHTDRKNMYQILDLTLKNTTICPAVADIVHKILAK